MPTTKKQSHEADSTVRVPIGAWLGGLLLALVGLGCSAALSVSTLLSAYLPGCGPGSPCAQASASAWGRVPGLGWPTAFVATAYFAAVTIGWLCSRFGIARGARAALLVGGAGSAVFLVVSVLDKLYCPYCLVANGANLLLVGLAFVVLVPRSKPGAGVWGVPAGIMMFVATVGVLGVAGAVATEQARVAAEKQLKEDQQKMVQASGGAGAKPTPPGTTTNTSGTPATGPAPGPSPTAPPAPTAEPTVWSKGLTGRYRRGPEVAKVRVVMLTDYQCPDCKRIEADVRAMMAKYPEVSVAIKYFPFCTDCNPTISRNLHGNACWAARAAETAGVLDGVDGFWRMHTWLFDRGGGFTNAELRAALPGLGFDPDAFDTVMQSTGTLERVKEDIADGFALGLMFTPMTFINGVELRGWNAPQAVSRAVEAILAQNPVPASADGDRPPLAVEKGVNDWRQNPATAQPDPLRPALGNSAGKVSVILYGDFLEPGTFEADSVIRAIVKSNPEVRYEFRLFPMDKSCNSKAPQTLFPTSCLAARALEGSRLAAGSDAPVKMWAMHEWLMNNRGRLSEQAILDGAPAIGLDAQALSIAMAVPQVQTRIDDDVASALRLGVTGLPTVFVNGRLAPRWKLGDRVIIGRLIEEAAK
ncbi:MAG: DsbA family protein [Phycisphaerales bacterium]